MKICDKIFILIDSGLTRNNARRNVQGQQDGEHEVRTSLQIKVGNNSSKFGAKTSLYIFVTYF